MLSATLVLVGFLAFGPQAVLSNFQSISFSTIEQCGSFNVSFNGGKAPTSLPLTLTVLPFNATPISIPIPPSSWNDTTNIGAYITFLPLAAGTTLVASLDDASGNGQGLVSDVIQIAPSSNSSCLPSDDSQPQSLFTLRTPLSQCENFTVEFNKDVDSQPPFIRAFVPKGPSFNVQQNLPLPSDPSDTGSYLMNVTGGQEVALLFNDEQGNLRVSDIFTVGGDNSSSTACLSAGISNPTTVPVSTTQTSSGLSKTAMIVILVASIAIFMTVSVLLVIYIRSDRRTRAAQAKTLVHVEAGPVYIPGPAHEKPTPPPRPPRPSHTQFDPARLVRARPDAPQGRYLTDPPYQYDSSPGSSPPNGNSVLLASRPGVPHINRPPAGRSSREAADTLSTGSSARPISSIDIEGILNMASTRTPTELYYAEALTPQSGVVFPRSPREPLSPPSTGRSPGLLGERSTQNLDVPTSATPYGRFSTFTIDTRSGAPAGPTVTGASLGTVQLDPFEDPTAISKGVPQGIPRA
ncbi:hypothetical protein BV25DRAFT_728103 [Artomyces pyxidatus]|uniref:Uncharacterized protein n=1 Tax=Artomyces pyxidatus TaxID=48021 RepID=A0ACB8T0V2_9AGAM|nr:hypothetical protein BV25DRAFT_728103 [Artomyces pyxidatus]